MKEKLTVRKGLFIKIVVDSEIEVNKRNYQLYLYQLKVIENMVVLQKKNC